MNPEPMISQRELLERSNGWGKRLLDGPITFFPVRHHSPACAAHLSEWIARVCPRSIVIEGPSSFNRWIPCLVDEQCRPPVAVLTTYRPTSQSHGPRHSAFYPLCDYSPEWIAVRQGTAIGAKVQFADLEFADKVNVLFESTAEDQQEPEPSLLLTDESQWHHSQFIQRIVRRLGCRDFDELWDHLFESRFGVEDTHSFVGRLATYCDLSRMDHQERLAKDGTLAREAVMEKTIRAEFARLEKPTEQGTILVVTGGFHTVALAPTFDKSLTAQNVKTKTSTKPSAKLAKTDRTKQDKPLGDSARDEAQSNSWLIRYSYDQLDSLNGYQSGMPSPGFYDWMWRARSQSTTVRHAVAKMISEIARSTRGTTIPHEASVTDSIAAVAMLDQLAGLRGHEVPTRNDMLDAITSCMRKDSQVAADGLDAIVFRLLAGNAIGHVPASAGQPPIVDDFRNQCERLKLPATVIDSKQMSLELYRKPSHRQVSFFFHQLMYLGVPYAQLLDGPDFVHGYHLSKLSEDWQVGWSPGTEARLIEMASFGENVAGAAELRLEQEIRQMEKGETARDASAAVDKLITTCRMGLQAHGDRIIQLIMSFVAEDSVYASMASALSKLTLLMSAREPLEATRLDSLPDLVATCYRRACHLIDELVNVPDDQVDASLDGLCSMRELLSQVEDNHLDRELYVVALERLVAATNPFPRSEVAGAAAGILHSLGRLDENGVCHIIENYLDSSMTDVGAACGAVRGLMMTGRESFWRMRGLLLKIDQLFENWEEDRFRVALPHLRLAFSQLSPKEVDLVAERVAALHDIEDLGNLHHPTVTEGDMQFGLEIDRLMRRSMLEDGLDSATHPDRSHSGAGVSS